eukprot:UN07292
MVLIMMFLRLCWCRQQEQQYTKFGISECLKKLAIYDEKFKSMKNFFNKVEIKMRKYKDKMSPLEYQNKYATTIYTAETPFYRLVNRSLRQNNVNIHLWQFVFTSIDFST